MNSMALKKILLVDDDPDDLDILHEILQEVTMGYDIVMLHNGRQALNALETWKSDNSLPCLLVLDINMPIMDGKQMLRKLRDHDAYKQLPVVMFSTSHSLTEHEFAEKYDAEFVSKPSKYLELEALVGQFVTKCRFEAQKTA